MVSGKRPRKCSFLGKMAPIAEKGFYKAKLKQNLITQAAIQITTPDNNILKLSVLGLRYYDAASGQIASVATIKDSNAEILPPNRVIFRDAFDGIQADVVLTYFSGSFESDVVSYFGSALPHLNHLGYHLTRHGLKC